MNTKRMESAPKDRRQSARLAGRPGPPILMDPPRAEPNITMEGQNVNQNLLERLNESTEDRRQRLKRIIEERTPQERDDSKGEEQNPEKEKEHQVDDVQDERLNRMKSMIMMRTTQSHHLQRQMKNNLKHMVDQ